MAYTIQGLPSPMSKGESSHGERTHSPMGPNVVCCVFVKLPEFMNRGLQVRSVSISHVSPGLFVEHTFAVNASIGSRG